MPNLITEGPLGELNSLRASTVRAYNEARRREIIASTHKQACLQKISHPDSNPALRERHEADALVFAVLQAEEASERSILHDRIREVDARLIAATPSPTVDETSAAGFLPAQLSRIGRAMTPDLIELAAWAGEPKAIETVDESSTFAGRKVRIKVLVRLL